MISLKEFESANRRGKGIAENLPHAVSAKFDRKVGRIVVELSSRLIISFSPADVEGLSAASPAQLRTIEISPTGLGLHFPAIDADLYVPGLLEGLLGTKHWMASGFGRLGGKSRSQGKKTAARENGKLGGRPRKTAGT